jgi:hypothetical protein
MSKISIPFDPWGPVPHVPRPESRRKRLLKSLLLWDTFTDVTGTNITAHTMNIGPGWTVSGTTWTIQTNQVEVTGASGGTIYAGAGVANVTASVDVNITATTAVRHGHAGRFSDANNAWRTTLNQSGGLFELVEVASGTSTVRASASLTVNTGTAYTIAVTYNGTTITATVNGGSQISYGSASSNQTVTNFGCYAGTSNKATFDNFVVNS